MSFTVDPSLMDMLMDRYQEQVEEAEEAWLRRRAAARAPRWGDALVVWASNLLISAGHRLQGSYRATGWPGDVALPTAAK